MSGAAGYCQAKRPLFGPGHKAWELICHNPATETWEYGCIHEHIRRDSICAEHRPEPGAVGCMTCFELGHECEMVARPAELTE